VFLLSTSNFVVKGRIPDYTTHPHWWCYLPVVLLIGVAYLQIWLTRSADLTLWSGGGFGMFTTVDG